MGEANKGRKKGVRETGDGARRGTHIHTHTKEGKIGDGERERERERERESAKKGENGTALQEEERVTAKYSPLYSSSAGGT
mgnify:CR=1 FL=1